MYIIAIAWIYVTLLMAATEKSITAGLLTFLFYGLIPCALLMWILGAKHRRRQHAKSLLNQNMDKANGGNTNTDE